MKKPLFALGIGFLLALAATAQTSSQTQTPPVSSTTPATQVGSGAQTKAGTPAPATTTSPSQVSPTGTAEPPAQATGGEVGAASSSAPSSPSSEASTAGADAVSDPELEGQIQNALNKEPTLTGDSTHVTVSADTIELAGNVGTSKEKVTATRIVQSYAGNKKVMNHLTISGKGEPRNPQQENPDANHPAGTANPTTNPEPSKGSQPPTSQPPLR